MLNVKVTGVKGYSYTGYILDSELTDEQLKCLGLKRDAEYVSEIAVEGDFIVEWDDDIAMPQIENCQLIGAPNGSFYNGPLYNVKWSDIDTRIQCSKMIYGPVPATYTIDLELDSLNIETMENAVSEWDDGNWAEDRLSSQIDAAYDSYMDR
jgi:hypothetical protein